ncbi:MAG TPA: methylamine utilization protein MauJ [Verrucomicrobiae bacterium]|nr:methylamine utilization protein MauJ [Verrucomicrobiae bacterium]
MHIGFDNSSRLRRDVYCFEYKGTRFKLIQNDPRRNSDVLLTILPGSGIGRSPSEQKARIDAFSRAAEFLSALGWQNNSAVKVWDSGGCSSGRVSDLAKANCSIFSFSKIPFSGIVQGYQLWKIPFVETPEQRIALALFREASSANHDYLSFLFYWQVLTIGHKNPIGWVNKTFRKKRDNLPLDEYDLKLLHPHTKNLGEYFNNDCRNAIAHIVRRDGGRQLRLDDLEDDSRMVVSKRVIEEFARFYIKDALALTKVMYLVWKNDPQFPVYVSEEELKDDSHRIAFLDLQ